MQVLLRILFPVLILGLGWLGYLWLSDPKEKERRQRPTARPLQTQVLKLELTDHTTTIHTQGVVQAQEESIITPEVSGKVKTIHSGFQDGAFFEKNDILLELDTTDFNSRLTSIRAQVARAKAALAQEEAKGRQAEANWKELKYTGKPNDLVLRKPQLREAQANLEAAKADEAIALRNLSRAVIKAPYAGRVTDRTVSYEESVSPGTSLGTVFSTDFAEVRLPIAASQLEYLDLPEQPGDPPLDVVLSDALSASSKLIWPAKIVRTEGALNESSRELFAIARIKDPFGRESGKPPLRLGQPVRAAIPGKVLKDVFVISRKFVRKLQHIYTVEPNEEKDGALQLTRHIIDPIWTDLDNVVFRSDAIADGTNLATSRQIYSPNHAKVEILPDPVPEPDPNAAPEGTRTGNDPKKNPKKKNGGSQTT